VIKEIRCVQRSMLFDEGRILDHVAMEFFHVPFREMGGIFVIQSSGYISMGNQESVVPFLEESAFFIF